ncbi:MAG: HAD-IA family hydrolase [Candidatus Staskawiczbacteria bacterium]|nr:HAD-IA family hydrolase [Candidatus Staskawiczbacteria bacterium]
MIKAVIFDLNGLFIQSPNLSDRFKEKFGVPTERFLPILKQIMAKVRLPGAEDTFDYWKPYLDKWGIVLNKKDFFDFWFNAEKENSELVRLAKQAKEKGIKLFILSNNFAERANYYKVKFLFLNIFDKVYYSWQTGFVKPNPEAFRNLLAENNLKPEECAYFDNSKENIEVAKNLGISSFLFETNKKLESILAKYQLI